MALELLSRIANWRICEESRDVRGMKLVDDAGGSLGTVRDLIVNTESGAVERLVTDNLAEYPLYCVDLRGELLRLRRDEFLSEAGAAAAPESETALHIRCERV
jgi:hypothetical protein